LILLLLLLLSFVSSFAESEGLKKRAASRCFFSLMLS
jgi:hypothetical protein